jgi:hypothetical protein
MSIRHKLSKNKSTLLFESLVLSDKYILGSDTTKKDIMARFLMSLIVQSNILCTVLYIVALHLILIFLCKRTRFP